jgi:hypothetical protein
MANVGKKRRAPSSEQNSAESGEALMDSLPYVDEVHEDYEHYALALIEEEMKKSKAPDLDNLPPVNFRAPLMELEYRRFIDSDGKPEPIQLQGTSGLASPPNGVADVEAWRNAVKKAKSEFEAERSRSVVLEVKKDAGAALLWKGFNEKLDHDFALLQQALTRQKELVEQINLQRSEDQQKTGKQLHILTTKYQSALERKFQLQQAIVALESEIEQLS